MSSERAQAYAAALFSVAKAEGRVADIEDELFQFGQALRGADQLRETLADASLPPARRIQIVEDLLGGRASPATTALVSMVVGAGRGGELPQIIDEVVQLSATEANKELAIVRTAIDLDEEQKRRLAEALEARTGRPVTVRVVVDESLLGGVVAQVGDTVIDGSVRRRLEQLKQAI